MFALASLSVANSTLYAVAALCIIVVCVFWLIGRRP